MSKSALDYPEFISGDQCLYEEVSGMIFKRSDRYFWKWSENDGYWNEDDVTVNFLLRKTFSPVDDPEDKKYVPWYVHEFLVVDKNNDYIVKQVYTKLDWDNFKEKRLSVDGIVFVSTVPAHDPNQCSAKGI